MTKIAIKVSLNAFIAVACPLCGQTLNETLDLPEDSIRTGNTTQTARYAVDDARSRIAHRMRARGWTDTMCGRCRDSPVGEGS